MINNIQATHPLCRVPFSYALANLGRFALADGLLVAEAYTSVAIDFQNLDKELIAFLELIRDLVDTLVRYL